MYIYQIWGATLESDVPLEELGKQEQIDEDDELTDLKRKLLELKVKIDCRLVLTGKFTIKNRIASAFCEERSLEQWKQVFEKMGERAPLCYSGDLNDSLRDFNPIPIYE